MPIKNRKAQVVPIQDTFAIVSGWNEDAINHDKIYKFDQSGGVDSWKNIEIDGIQCVPKLCVIINVPDDKFADCTSVTLNP